MDEKHLIEQAGKRDAEAFFTLITPYVSELYAACQEKPGVPEELLQSVFLRAWHGIPLFRADIPVISWLMDILEDEASKKRGKSRVKKEEQAENLTDEQLLRLVRGSIIGETQRSSPLYLLKRIRFTLIALAIVVVMLLLSRCQQTPMEVTETPPPQTTAAETTAAPPAAFAPGS